METKQRLAKVMAQAGIASRRACEALILEGAVTLNGAVVETPATLVGPDDAITVNGKPLPQEQPLQLWLYHKPVGLLTTHKDPEGRPTVFDYLPENLPRVISVGRLDLNSEGLLLLTTQGAFARLLEHPSTGLPRTYHVRIFGTYQEKDLQALSRGISIEGIHYGAVQARTLKNPGQNAWLEITLHEGKNREIRKILAHLGLKISRLRRVSYGPFQLDDLPLEACQEVPRALVQKIFDDLLAENNL